jgi:hypothetical protein
MGHRMSKDADGLVPIGLSGLVGGSDLRQRLPKLPNRRHVDARQLPIEPLELPHRHVGPGGPRDTQCLHALGCRPIRFIGCRAGNPQPRLLYPSIARSTIGPDAQDVLERADGSSRLQPQPTACDVRLDVGRGNLVPRYIAQRVR